MNISAKQVIPDYGSFWKQRQYTKSRFAGNTLLLTSGVPFFRFFVWNLENGLKVAEKEAWIFFQASFPAISLIAVYLRGSIRYLSPAGLIWFISYMTIYNTPSFITFLPCQTHHEILYPRWIPEFWTQNSSFLRFPRLPEQAEWKD